MLLSTKVFIKLKPLLFFFLILPSLFWFFKFFQGNFGVNPIDKLMDELGRFSLKLLILTLLVSSLSKYSKLRSLVSIRRMIGLFAFYYILLHFLSYIILDHFFNFEFILKDIAKRPFITLGFISFLLLLPLVITSSDGMIKLLTFKVWKKIHYLIYIIAPLAGLHFYLLTKADKTEPLVYLVIILLLLVWRIVSKFLKIRNINY